MVNKSEKEHYMDAKLLVILGVVTVHPLSPHTPCQIVLWSNSELQTLVSYVDQTCLKIT